MQLSNFYSRFRSRCSWGFMHRFYAVGADELADALYFGVLKIWIFAHPVDGIIVATKQAAFAAHL
jgi:hypothetical protein